MEGSAQFLVLAVGLNSQTGTIMKLMGAARDDESSLDDDDDFDNISIKAKILCNYLIFKFSIILEF